MWKLALFKIAPHTLGRLPVPVLYGLLSLIANLIYTLAPGPRRNVWNNLRHVMPAGTPKSKMRTAARRIFRNVALYYGDLIRMPRMNIDHFVHHRLTFQGFQENLQPAIDAGNGVILMSGHYGNPELAVQVLIPMGVRLFALTEPVKPPALSRLINGFRSSTGHEFTPVSVGSVKTLMQRLRQGQVVALMSDRDIQGPRAVLPFCGTQTLMPTGPIEVALRTGAAVVPAFSWRTGRHQLVGSLEKPLELQRTGDLEQDVRAGTLRFLERLERHLREDPSQWLVLEAIWAPLAEPALETASAGRGKA
ncbi:MAG: lysophospholipid acyltransferase family protein [Dehalococcoidia bacterium]